MDSLKDYTGAHEGATAWVFGKGPSLATFEMDTAGPLRLAINDVIAHIPGATYGFANDGVGRWADAYKPGQVLFQPSRCLHEYDSTRPGAVACKVVTFVDDYAEERLALPPAELAECLDIRRGTLGSLLQIAYIMGIKSMHLVGVDGGNTHAPGFVWKTRLRAQHYKDYNSIRSGAIETADLLGITLHFHTKHREIMQDQGKIRVTFTRSSAVSAQHYDKGTTASFPPVVAEELIQAGAAILEAGQAAPAKEVKPEPPKEEKAEAAPAKETAAKKKGGKKA